MMFAAGVLASSPSSASSSRCRCSSVRLVREDGEDAAGDGDVVLLQVDVLAEGPYSAAFKSAKVAVTLQLLLDDAHLLGDLVLLGVEQLLRLVLCDLVIALAKGVAVVGGKGGATAESADRKKESP